MEKGVFMKLSFAYIILALIVAVSNVNAEDKVDPTFTLKTIGIVTLKVEKKEVVNVETKEDSAHPDAKEFDNRYIIDTYKLLSADGKVIWSKLVSNPKVFFERNEFSGLINNIGILSVECLNEKIFVVYSTMNKVWIDELLLDEKKEWVINKNTEIMSIVSFSPIKKCVISINETDKKQVKIKFDLVGKGEESYYYENGVVKKN